jgi:uncharacterized protein (TIGR01777 family)
MDILITGGTGFIGSALGKELKKSGHSVIITTRKKTQAKQKLTWNPPDLIPPDRIESIDAVINLAGESIASGRWTDKKKERIRSSRVDTTRALVQSLRHAKIKPKTLISASAVGYYGPHGNKVITEQTPAGADFLAEVAQAWEKEAFKADELGIRVVIVRFGTVLEADGGALKQMAVPFKLFLGGTLGSGEQWFAWVHRDDLIGIIQYVLEHETITGPVNVTAPELVTNREFCSALGEALGRPSWLFVPGFALKVLIGEFGGVLLTGQRVIPEKALKAGYKFKYPEIRAALKAIFDKKHSA